MKNINMKNIITKCKGGCGYVHIGRELNNIFAAGQCESSCQLAERVTCYVAFSGTVKLEKGKIHKSHLNPKLFSCEHRARANEQNCSQSNYTHSQSYISVSQIAYIYLDS